MIAITEDEKFFIEQLAWCQQQDNLLAEIEYKLHLMKAIAEYAATKELLPYEVDRLQLQLAQLTQEVHALEQQLNTLVH